MLRIAICDDDKILVTQIEEMLNRYLDKKMIGKRPIRGCIEISGCCM